MLEAHLSGKSHKKKLKQLGIEDFAGDMETSSKGKILTLEQKYMYGMEKMLLLVNVDLV